jgi:hypothetical protein
VLLDRDLIRRTFRLQPGDRSCCIRRAGAIASQQMGQYMLEQVRARGGRLVRGRVVGIARAEGFRLTLDGADGASTIRADVVVDAAGPHVGSVAAMLGERLPVTNVLQQKITFEDREGAIPRAMPFSIDLDGQSIDWTGEERAALAADPEYAWLAGAMPGSIHCRPEGGDAGRWIKLGWAYNRTPGEPVPEPAFDPHFPEVVLRGAARLNPSLRTYYGRLPRGAVLYGGYYTMTPENWPLIGPLATPGAFVAGALSGFGTMAPAPRATSAPAGSPATAARIRAQAGPRPLRRRRADGRTDEPGKQGGAVDGAITRWPAGARMQRRVAGCPAGDQ